MQRSSGAVLALILSVLAGSAAAQSEGRSVRFVGDFTGGPDGKSTRLVIDARIVPSDERFRSTVEGWLGAIEPGGPTGAVEGGCIEMRCAISASTGDGTLALTGDIAAERPVATPVRFAWTRSGEDAVEGGATLQPAGDDIPGLGRLAAPGAITAPDLADQVVWAGVSYGFTNDFSPDAPGGMERDALAGWKAGVGRAGGGLITVDDLVALRAAADAARAAARWTPLSGSGWRGGYPAALLSPKPGAGPGQRFESTDGKAAIIFVVEPAMDSDAFDALVDRETADRAGRERRGYTRVNDEFEQTYEEGGALVFELWRRREHGLAHLTFRHPLEGGEIYEPWADILGREFKATDELRAP